MTNTQTKTKWFLGVNNKKDLRIEYLKLSKKYHPDISVEKNSLEIMKEINNEYEKLEVGLPLTSEEKTKSNKEQNIDISNLKDIINSIIKYDIGKIGRASCRERV